MSNYIPPHLRNRPSSSGSGTMASMTHSSTATRSSRPSVVTPQSHEFPSLSVLPNESKDKKSVWSREKTFATLAQEWGVQKREQEERDRQLAKERMTKAQLEKEEKEKERSYYRVNTMDSMRLIYESQNGGTEEKAKQRRQADQEDEDDDLAMGMNDDDEDDQQDVDSDWSYRRHRNELY